MFQNSSLQNSNFLNLLIWTLPFSIILGNLFINLNSLFIILVGIYIFSKNLNQFIIKYINYVILFLIIIFINLFLSSDLYLSLKGVFGLTKNILFSLIFYLWLKNENGNLKSILLSIFLAQLILIISLYLNLGIIFFSNTSLEYAGRIDGLFLDENVAGSYIIKFLIPSIFLFVIFFKNKKYLIYFLLLSFVSILVTGDRAPLFLFFLAIIFFIMFNKRLKLKNSLLFLLSLGVITLIFFLSSSNFRDKVTYTSGQFGLKYIEKKIYNIQKDYFKEKEYNYSEWIKYEKRDGEYNFTDTEWFKHYSKAFEIGKHNLLFGSGIKTFRKACKDPKYNIKFKNSGDPNFGCSTHPHNIYIEIFSETGITGTLIFLSIIFTLIIKSIKNKDYDLKMIIFTYLLIIFSPLQTTGSFFSTFNGIFYFICLSLVLHLNNYYKSIK